MTSSLLKVREEILFDVPQGSILGPLLFNIFLCALFAIMNNLNFTSYVDYNAPHVIGDGVIQVIKYNPDRFNLITSNSDEVNLCVGNYSIESSKSVKLLEIKIDNKLNINNRIDEICKIAGQTFNALSRVTSYMDLPKQRMFLNAFFLSQVNYCPLIWMFHSRGKDNKINRFHEIYEFFTNIYKSFIVSRN